MKQITWVLLMCVTAAAACRSRNESQTTGDFTIQTAKGSISLEISPRILADGRLSLELRADTHSGDLSEVDLQQGLRLRVDGKDLPPVQAPSLSGHHDGGSVVFEPKTRPEHFAVAITGVRGLPEQVLEW